VKRLTARGRGCSRVSRHRGDKTSARWSVLELLEGSPYKDRFKGGIFTHSFLNTTDYHRLHVPVGGRVLESRVIHGQVYLDVTAVRDHSDTTRAPVSAKRTLEPQGPLPQALRAAACAAGAHRTQQGK
jgi:hypothetical protein